MILGCFICISRLISSVIRYGRWNMIRGSLLGVLDDMSHDSKNVLSLFLSTSSPNHVPHPVSSHTANELPRIISFVPVSSHTANELPRIISFVSRIVSLC
eukprot:sb/3478718/